jgi:hypothetical protein
MGDTATLALESVNIPSATDATGFRGPFLGLDLTWAIGALPRCGAGKTDLCGLCGLAWGWRGLWWLEVCSASPSKEPNTYCWLPPLQYPHFRKSVWEFFEIMIRMDEMGQVAIEPGTEFVQLEIWWSDKFGTSALKLDMIQNKLRTENWHWIGWQPLPKRCIAQPWQTCFVLGTYERCQGVFPRPNAKEHWSTWMVKGFVDFVAPVEFVGGFGNIR